VSTRPIQNLRELWQTVWERRDDFMQDPDIELTGYMPTFDDLLTGLFLFNHRCGTTLACPVDMFRASL
jgi:hypothetical protein